MDSGLIRRWAVLVVMLGALCVGVPRNAGPDEPAHAVRATAVVRGQVFGEPTELGDAYRAFDVPLWAEQPDPSCFAMHSERAAGCASVEKTAGNGPVVSSAASYPVPGHIVAGLATLVPGGARTAYLSRIFGALVTGGVVAAALGRAARRGPEAVLVMLLAMTPAALFTLVVINPSGFAVAGALALAAALPDLTRGDRSAGGLLLLGSACLVLTRPDGWVWFLLMVGLAWLAWGTSALRRALAAVGSLGRWSVAAMLGFAVAWTVAVRPELIQIPTSERGSDLVWAVLTRTSLHLDGAIGLFGWNDTRIPRFATYGWWLVLGATVTMAWLRGSTRIVVACLTGLAGFLAIGWVADLASARSVGLVWQGRYGLPLFIGAIALLGAAPLAQERSGTDHLLPWARVMCTLTGVIWVAGYWQALRRWSVGDVGTPFPWSWERGASLLHPFLSLIVFSCAVSMLVLDVLASSRPRSEQSESLSGSIFQLNPAEQQRSERFSDE